MIKDFCMKPLREGEVPPSRKLKLIDGEWAMVQEKVEYDPDWVDPEIMETETYLQEDKEEFYDYLIRCKACWTEFIAYNKHGEKTMNYCPECGKKLT